MQKAKNIIKQYKLDIPAETETAYNIALKRLPNIIVSHKALYKNVEFADAIFWDESTMYLMHNKGEFNGIGARDLINQILTAAECLQRNLGTSGYKGLPQYYRAICQINKMQEMPQANRDTFIKLFSTRKICFITGFIKGFKVDSSSTYAKYLTIEANKRMSAKGFEFIPLDTGKPKVTSTETVVLPFPPMNNRTKSLRGEKNIKNRISAGQHGKERLKSNW